MTTYLRLDDKESQLIQFCLLKYANDIKDEMTHYPDGCIKADKYKESYDYLVTLANKVKVDRNF